MALVDDKILKALKGGEMKSFEIIYRLYNSHIYNFIYRMIKNTSVSKDLTQDVFLQIWNTKNNIEYDNNFEGYLFTMTRNTVYQYIRREILLQNYINKLGKDKDEKTDVNIEGELDNKYFEERISELIEELPEARRRIFLLYWKSDLSYKEIAQTLSLSEKTIATQVNRSLQFLRDRMTNIAPIAILLCFSNI